MNKQEQAVLPGGAPTAQPGAPVDPNQKIETNAYVPTYNIKPEFQQAVLKAIGKYPFNQIQQIMNAIRVATMDHNTLTQIMNALGSFPYQDVAGILMNVNDFIEMIQPGQPEDADGGDPPVAEEAPVVEEKPAEKTA